MQRRTPWYLKQAVPILLLVLFSVQLSATAISVTTGSTFNVTYNGYQTAGGPISDGLTAKATFSGFSFDYDAANDMTGVTFAVTVTNTSTSPITSSRVSILGFDTTPNVVANPAPHTNSVTPVAPATWPTNININKNFAYGIGTVEFCFDNNHNNCTGGTSAGVVIGASTSFIATVWFSGEAPPMTFDNFYVKYQDVSGGCASSCGGTGTAVLITGDGTPPQPVPTPEPATLSFLGAGLAWRLRRFRRRK